MATAVDLATRLDRTLRAAGLAIIGVSIGDPLNRATWKVQPVSLQATAQPTIDTFNPDAVSVIDAETTANATVTSRQKDILAMCAVIVRERSIAAWTAMSPQEKKDATFALADVWRAMREFAEKNL